MCLNHTLIANIWNKLILANSDRSGMLWCWLWWSIKFACWNPLNAWNSNECRAISCDVKHTGSSWLHSYKDWTLNSLKMLVRQHTSEFWKTETTLNSKILNNVMISHVFRDFFFATNWYHKWLTVTMTYNRETLEIWCLLVNAQLQFSFSEFYS